MRKEEYRNVAKHLDQGKRKRLRELGVSIGRIPPGPHNAITDVAGVRVGHATIVTGEGPLRVGEGPVRTGVTVIVLLALSDDGAPAHDHVAASDLAALGATVFAVTPDAFPEVLAAALEGRDLGRWATEQGLVTAVPTS